MGCVCVCVCLFMIPMSEKISLLCGNVFGFFSQNSSFLGQATARARLLSRKVQEDDENDPESAAVVTLNDNISDQKVEGDALLQLVGT